MAIRSLSGWIRRLFRYPAPPIFSLLLLVVFLYAAWLALDFPESHRLVPFLILVPAIVATMIVTVAELRAVHAGSAVAGGSWSSDAIRFAWVGLFMSLVFAVGYPAGLALGVFTYARRAREHPVIAAALGVSAILIVWIFETQFRLHLPDGVIIDLL